MRTISLLVLIILLASVSDLNAQAKAKSKPPKSKRAKPIPRPNPSSLIYAGSPETDKAFALFISKNLTRVVHLDLKINDKGWISDGYRGVQSMVIGAKTNGIDYSYFLECDQNPDADTAIGQCGNLVQWNESTGELSGYFKVLRIIKSGVRNYRAVFLAPVKKQ